MLITAPRPAIAAAVSAARPVTHTGLWPLVWANTAGAALNEEENCIATAVYFEARGEGFDGQLAVAEVVMNRAYSGRYPSSYCAVVKQPWQFSFVRGGRFPRVNENSPAWSYAQAITRIAKQRLADALPDDVLWYHADYVAPVWGRRLSRVEKIGAHIFYRA
jgi:spore germination cell wall hydrolase CwlJ-like protein